MSTATADKTNAVASLIALAVFFKADGCREVINNTKKKDSSSGIDRKGESAKSYFRNHNYYANVVSLTNLNLKIQLHICK